MSWEDTSQNVLFIWLEAPHKDAARQKIKTGLAKLLNCKADDIEYYNLVSEFEAPDAVNNKVTGWRGKDPIAWDENPITLESAEKGGSYRSK